VGSSLLSGKGGTHMDLTLLHLFYSLAPSSPKLLSYVFFIFYLLLFFCSVQPQPQAQDSFYEANKSQSPSPSQLPLPLIYKIFSVKHLFISLIKRLLSFKVSCSTVRAPGVLATLETIHPQRMPNTQNNNF
jgi:hypothetical protein